MQARKNPGGLRMPLLSVIKGLRLDEPPDDSLVHELAASTSRFSHRAQRVVDDKLALSATLMRAGEVVEAHRLLVEAEVEFRTEEAAFLEQINEFTMARVMRRDAFTRARAGRMVAVAMLASAVFAFSAVGMTFVGIFDTQRVSTDSVDVTPANSRVSVPPEASAPHAGDTASPVVTVADPKQVGVTEEEETVAPKKSLQKAETGPAAPLQVPLVVPADVGDAVPAAEGTTKTTEAAVDTATKTAPPEISALRAPIGALSTRISL